MSKKKAPKSPDTFEAVWFSNENDASIYAEQTGGRAIEACHVWVSQDADGYYVVSQTVLDRLIRDGVILVAVVPRPGADETLGGLRVIPYPVAD